MSSGRAGGRGAGSSFLPERESAHEPNSKSCAAARRVSRRGPRDRRGKSGWPTSPSSSMRARLKRKRRLGTSSVPVSKPNRIDRNSRESGVAGRALAEGRNQAWLLRLGLRWDRTTTRLPCRRSWVRVPSSALRKAPLARRFFCRHSGGGTRRRTAWSQNGHPRAHLTCSPGKACGSQKLARRFCGAARGREGGVTRGRSRIARPDPTGAVLLARPIRARARRSCRRSSSAGGGCVGRGAERPGRETTDGAGWIRGCEAVAG
jgi:hypothetical protein